MKERYYLEALTFSIAYLTVFIMLIIMLVCENIKNKKHSKTNNQLTIK